MGAYVFNGRWSPIQSSTKSPESFHCRCIQASQAVKTWSRRGIGPSKVIFYSGQHLSKLSRATCSNMRFFSCEDIWEICTCTLNIIYIYYVYRNIYIYTRSDTWKEVHEICITFVQSCIYILIHTVYITIYIQNPERERVRVRERDIYIYIHRDTYTQTQTYIIYIPTFGPLDWPSTIFF